MENGSSSSDLHAKRDRARELMVTRYGYKFLDGTKKPKIDSTTSVSMLQNDVAGLNLVDGSRNVALELKDRAERARERPMPLGVRGGAGKRPMLPVDEETKNQVIQSNLAAERRWVKWLRETKESIGMNGLLKRLNGGVSPSKYRDVGKLRLKEKIVRILIDNDPDNPSANAPPTEKTTMVSVYRMNDISHPDIRYEVVFRAMDYQLYGCAVITEIGICVVVVGGDEKSIERYREFMLKGIKWNAPLPFPFKSRDEVNNCALVWEGTVVKPSFNRFKVHLCKTLADARQVFLDAGVTDYWNLALNASSSSSSSSGKEVEE